jgi:nicotinamidase-related amidase
VTAPVQALIVVDMQRGLLAGPSAVPGADALVRRVEELVRRAAEAGALVVQLQNDGTPGLADEPGTPGWELRLPGGEVLRKSTDDGFDFDEYEGFDK